MRVVANENINFIVRLYDELSHSLLLFLSSVFKKKNKVTCQFSIAYEAIDFLCANLRESLKYIFTFA